MKKAVAENAEILEDDGLTITYHPRCPMCGVIVESPMPSASRKGKKEVIKDTSLARIAEWRLISPSPVNIDSKMLRRGYSSE